jgi:hypothetical protein
MTPHRSPGHCALEDVAATIESEPGNGFLLIVTIPHGVEAKA